MEEEGIGLVLARATELRLKISNCIHKASSRFKNGDDNDDAVIVIGGKNLQEVDEEEVEEGEETERLLHICDALEALETQLGSLQALQLQQQYEREAALTDIENSREMLLDRLKEYNGKDLEVLHEASAFAGERVHNNGDLLLPPYPSRPSSLVLDKGYLSHLPSTSKTVPNGTINNIAGETQENYADAHKDSRKGLGKFIGVTLKTAVTLVGVVSVLNLTGLGTRVAKREIKINILGLFQAMKERRSASRCPPGKVLVVDNGQSRCVARERIEIPFESVVSAPDVNYGCG